jgi:hypothetical protein
MKPGQPNPDKPTQGRAIDPDVQAIWDRRDAQGQPAAYTAPYEPVMRII